MPPVRRPRPAYPQTARCRFLDDERQRCRRVATVEGKLCRHHALLLELELEDRGAPSAMLDAIDRAMSRGGVPLSTIVAEAMNGVLGNLLWNRQARSGQAPPDPRARDPRDPRDPRARHAPPPPQGARSGRPPPPPPRPPPDPTLRAREILGFEASERLTAEMVQKRRQALARVFHPDMAGGSTAQMTKVNQAADLLLAKLS